VGTNYTPSHIRSFLSTATEYFYSVTKPINFLITVVNFMAIGDHLKIYES